MTRLATPVVVAEVGWVTMGLVDIAMVGRLGPAAIGAVGIGSILFIAVVVFGIGTLLGLDPLVAQAAGAGRRVSITFRHHAAPAKRAAKRARAN